MFLQYFTENFDTKMFVMLVEHEYRRTSIPFSDKFKYTYKYYSVTLVKRLKYNSIIDVNIKQHVVIGLISL